MKKATAVIVAIAIAALSLVITLFVFETLSWYHLGHIPTPLVLGRLAFFFSATAACLTAAAVFFRKLKAHKGNAE